MSPEIIWGIGLAVLAPVAFILGRAYKRRRGAGFTMKQQLKHLAIVAVIFWILMVIAGLASADPPSPLPASVRAGAWTFTQKESALPFGPLCTNSAVIRGPHVTLKVAGAQTFEATLAIVIPYY